MSQSYSRTISENKGHVGYSSLSNQYIPSLNIHINMVIFEPVSIMEVFFSQFLPYRSPPLFPKFVFFSRAFCDPT